MFIYTKTGDNGKTALFGGKRVLKSDPQVEAYGSVDELTAFIGLAITKIKYKSDIQLLTEIQKNLYEIMASLSGAQIKLNKLDIEIKEFEKYIDKIDQQLPKIHQFVLPQGSEETALFHILRTICRRCERKVASSLNNPPSRRAGGAMEQWNKIIKYLNRLSDLFFIMARKYNKNQEVKVAL